MRDRNSQNASILEEEYAVAAGSPFTVGARQEELNPKDRKYLRRAGLSERHVAHIAGAVRLHDKALEWHHSR